MTLSGSYSWDFQIEIWKVIFLSFTIKPEFNWDPVEAVITSYKDPLHTKNWNAFCLYTFIKDQPCLPSFPSQRPSTASRPTRASSIAGLSSTTNRGRKRRTLRCRPSHGARTSTTRRHFNQTGIHRGGNFIRSINGSACTRSAQDGKLKKGAGGTHPFFIGASPYDPLFIGAGPYDPLF